jgi:ABC-type transport system involved in cytochrome c biogenesis ATPase subunit
VRCLQSAETGSRSRFHLLRRDSAMSTVKKDLPVLFEVLGLFEHFNHVVPLPTQDAPIKFVTAPNGYGKSTLLRLLADLAARRWHRLADVAYKEMRLSFESGDVLAIQRHRSDRGGARLRIRLASAGGESTEYDISASTLRKATYRSAANDQRYPPGFRSEIAHRYVTESWGSLVATFDHGDRGDIRPRLRAPELIENRLKGLRACYLDVNRLWATQAGSHGENQRLPAVSAIAHSVTKELLQARLAYASDSRDAERTFAYRVIEALQTEAPPLDQQRLDVNEQYARLREIDAFYQELGVSESGLTDFPVAMLADNPTAAFILSLHMTDIETRLKKLRPKVRRLAVYRDVINEMLRGKQIRFNGQFKSSNNDGQGLEVRLADGKRMPVESLSAGEQHLLVIFGRMLFDAPPRGGGMLLLDEPEISLHPQWQSIFGRVLRKLAEVNHCRVVVATHSPMMIGNAWDSEIDLAHPQVS